MRIHKIVITGGPCAGKTTGMKWIDKAFSAKGYRLVFIPETATELISGGVAPWLLESKSYYQECQLMLQLEKERIFTLAAKRLKCTGDVIIVCDRGTIDNKAYMEDADFKAVIGRLNLDEKEMYTAYDAVFHLETAAKGAEAAYTVCNNAARTETPDEAKIMDDKLILAWQNHSYFRIIGNCGSFDDKMNRLVSEIDTFLNNFRRNSTGE